MSAIFRKIFIDFSFRKVYNFIEQIKCKHKRENVYAEYSIFYVTEEFMKLKTVIPAAVSGVMLLSALSWPAAGAARSRVSVHDPSVVRDPATGTYYVFGSHIDAAKTTDLQNWTLFTNGYKTPGNTEFGDLSGNLKKAFDWCGEDLEDCKGGYAVWAGCRLES